MTERNTAASILGLGGLPDGSIAEKIAGHGQPIPPTPLGKPKTVRLTANLPVDAGEQLDAAARSTGFNKLTTLVRAIRVFHELLDADARQAKVIIEEADGTKSRLLLR